MSEKGRDNKPETSSKDKISHCERCRCIITKDSRKKFCGYFYCKKCYDDKLKLE